jgi:predicted Zn-dependent protease
LFQKGKLTSKGYFALAHEVAHILQRHETRNAQARLIDAVSLRGGIKDLITMMKNAADRNRTMIATLLGGKLLFEQHFSSQELAADACGMRLLSRALNSEKELLDSVSAFASSLPPSKEPAKVNATSSSLNDSIKNANDVVELVTRPVDQHPNSDVRLKFFSEMLKILRNRG